ncbi:arylamine N-acetyltransferase family protein [Rossellomorea vietnamensis]|uniref:arylamine N-acetyltransferase family protein n=1 Tax=Rossellomorea vietnamensis TaxID=218284 RepID=UPI000B29FDE3
MPVINNLDKRFRDRIHFSPSGPLTFEDLDSILGKMAHAIPFENVRIIEKRSQEMSEENIIDKVLVRKEGGLCYELNSLLYLFLKENHFEASLIQGIVYDTARGEFGKMGRTHVAILVQHENQLYIVDGGFGGNLPMKPVPLSGETVSSSNGEFRISEGHTAHGHYQLEMKLKHKDTDWRIGYAFDIEETISDVSRLNGVRITVEEHAESPFNKHPLLTKRTDGGSVTLTDKSFTRWEAGKVTKEEIDSERYNELLNIWFPLSN